MAPSVFAPSSRLSRLRLPRLASSLLLATAALGFFAAPSHAQGKKILFLSGPKDHGAPGRHEYVLDLETLAQSFEKATNLKGVTTQHIVGKAPTDMAAYKDVAAIVIESSSDRDPNETHPLFPPDAKFNHGRYDAETTAFLKQLNDTIKANNIGIVLIHYATWAENSAGKNLYFEWTGGLWVNPISKNPVDEWSMAQEPEAKGHPIWNGVKPWTEHDEVFCRFMLPDDKRRTNLVRGTAKADQFKIGPQIASFAYQRDDGGRGFVYGGQDWRNTLGGEDHRRFMMNGIAWAANIDIPAEGIQSPTPDVSNVSPPVQLPFGPRAGGPGAVPGGAPAASPARDAAVKDVQTKLKEVFPETATRPKSN